MEHLPDKILRKTYLNTESTCKDDGTFKSLSVTTLSGTSFISGHVTDEPREYLPGF